jgi:hypothetical protein
MHRVVHGPATASVMFTRTVIDWSELRDQHNHPEVEVAELLDRAERAPSADVWQRLDGEHDDLARANPAALATLHRLAESRLPGMSGRRLTWSFQAACAFAGYTFWAVISLDFTDEHYRIHCPHCATPLMIVISDYGHYAAIRDDGEGDILRQPLRPAQPAALDGFRRWMHDTAVACRDPILAEGLTYLFGDATCSNCHSTFNVADWFEAENSPAQPIDAVVPRTGSVDLNRAPPSARAPAGEQIGRPERPTEHDDRW